MWRRYDAGADDLADRRAQESLPRAVIRAWIESVRAHRRSEQFAEVWDVDVVLPLWLLGLIGVTGGPIILVAVVLGASGASHEWLLAGTALMMSAAGCLSLRYCIRRRRARG